MKKQKIFKTLIFFFLIEIVIILLGTIAVIQNEKAVPENTEEIAFFTKEIDYNGTPKHEKIIIYSDFDHYTMDLLCLPKDSAYSPREIQEILSDQKITLTYKKVFNLFGEFNAVVDIRCEDTVFYSIDDFNAERTKQLTSGIVLLSLIQLLYLFALWVYLLVCKEDFKKVFRKKRSQ